MKVDPNGSVKTIRLSTRTGLLAMIYCVIWVSTYFAVKGFFIGSPARNVYGLMCAWWAALYISSLLRIPIQAIAYLAIFSLFLTSAIFAVTPEWIYHDLPSGLNPSFWGILILGITVFFISPVVLNSILDATLRRLLIKLITR